MPSRVHLLWRIRGLDKFEQIVHATISNIEAAPTVSVRILSSPTLK